MPYVIPRFDVLCDKAEQLLTNYKNKKKENQLTLWFSNPVGTTFSRIGDIDFIQKVARHLATGEREAKGYQENDNPRQQIALAQSNQLILFGAFLLVVEKIHSDRSALCLSLRNALNIDDAFSISSEQRHSAFAELYAYLEEKASLLSPKEKKSMVFMLKNNIDEYQKECAMRI